MGKSSKLPRAPLTFASLEFRFNEDIDDKILKNAVEKLRVDKRNLSFQLYGVGRRRQVVLGDSGEEQESERKFYLFVREEDRSRSFAVGQNFFALTTLDYSDFEEYYNDFSKMFALFGEIVGQDIQINRVDIRFVDVIREIDEVSVVDLIRKDFFDVAARKDDSVSQLMIGREFNNNVSLKSILFRCRKNDKKKMPFQAIPTGLSAEDLELGSNDYLLDSSIRRVFDEPPKSEDVADCVDEMHRRLNRFFFDDVATEEAQKLWSREEKR